MTNLSTFLNHSIGFEDIFDRFNFISNINTSFPPFNIKKVGENKYTLEMALAGYSKKDIKVEVVNPSVLIIEGSSLKNEGDFVHKGIAERSFKKHLQLQEYVECRGAKLEDGMLKIQLEYSPPENKKNKVIKID
tara:strand:- start:8656 stop:9057 length:402 start_codon:yes stop_codon:yes gene_type:complete